MRPGSPERAELKARLAAMAAERIDIPVIIGGKEIRTGNTAPVVMPHKHGHVLGTWHKASAEHVRQAVDAALEARREWASWPFEDRAAVFLRAAELLTTTWRADAERRDDAGPVEDRVSRRRSTRRPSWSTSGASTPHFAAGAARRAARSARTASGTRSSTARSKGFVYAVTPFNFTAIGGNLSGAPALMGNTVVWKPAATAMLAQLLHLTSCSRPRACRRA